MRNEIVVLPLNGAPFVYFEGRRIELNVPHRDLCDGRRSWGGGGGRLNVTGTDEEKRDRYDRDAAQSDQPKTAVPAIGAGSTAAMLTRNAFRN